MSLKVRASLETPVERQHAHSLLRDLSQYPKWLEIVHSVEREVNSDSAWWVELRGKVGPFARSKRLRMVRTADDQNSCVVFERQECDGRRHSDWKLSVYFAGEGVETLVSLEIYYGGSMFTGGVLERMLAEQIEKSRKRLIELIAYRS